MLPSSVGGDVLRVWRARQHGMPLAVATTGVFLDRLSALIAVLFAVLVGMPLLFKKVEIPGFAEAVGVLLGTAFVGLVSLVVLDRIALLPRHWHVTTLLHRLAADSRTLFIHPLTSFILLVYSSLVLVLTALSLYWIAIGLSVPLDLLDALVFTPLVVLITILPISIAGWGVREFGMATLLVHVGVSATEAVSLSLVQGLMLLAVSFPGAVLWTTTRGYMDRA